MPTFLVENIPNNLRSLCIYFNCWWLKNFIFKIKDRGITSPQDVSHLVEITTEACPPPGEFFCANREKRNLIGWRQQTIQWTTIKSYKRLFYENCIRNTCMQ